MREWVFETSIKAMGVNKAYKVGKKGTGKDKQGMYKNPEYRSYQNHLRRKMRKSMTGVDIFEYPVKVMLLHYYSTKHKRDIDGPIKGILDCLNGIVLTDDILIEDLHVRITRGTGSNGIKIKVVEL